MFSPLQNKEKRDRLLFTQGTRKRSGLKAYMGRKDFKATLRDYLRGKEKLPNS